MSFYLRCAAVLVAVLAACGPLERGMEGHRDIVAQVDGYTLTVDHAAQLLAPGNPAQVTAHPATVDRLTELWVGYTILTSELVRPDTFAGLEEESLLGFARDQDIVWQLQQRAIMERITPSDEELRAAYEREEPFTRVKAQHILIRVPQNADSVAADSLRRLAEEIRQRAVSGEDFGGLARRFSQDPGTASQGGDLGYVERGRLVPQVEKVAFSLEPGEISEPVRSTFGYHIIKVSEVERPDFESVAERYRTRLIEGKMTERENAYIDSLFEAASPDFRRGFVPLMRRFAASSRLARLSPAERQTPLVRFRGGTVTVGEWADFVIRNGPNVRNAFIGGDSTAVVAVLREMVRNELLVKAAREEGLRVSEATMDSLAGAAERDLFGAAVASGLRRPLIQPDQESVQRAVDGVIHDLVTGQRGARPIERLLPALRAGHAIQIHPARFRAVAERVALLRGENQAAQEARPGEPGS